MQLGVATKWNSYWGNNYIFSTKLQGQHIYWKPS